MFVNHIIALAQLSLLDVSMIIQDYLNSTKKKITFKNNMPGWKRGKLFLNRHQNVNEKIEHKISRNQAQTNDGKNNCFFDKLEPELKDVHPENIHNFDETGYHDVPSNKKLLFAGVARILVLYEIPPNHVITLFTVVMLWVICYLHILHSNQTEVVRLASRISKSISNDCNKNGLDRFRNI